MGSRILFSLVAAAFSIIGFAQADDMYFVPQKVKKEKTEQKPRTPAPVVAETPVTAADDEVAGGSDRDVDEYNRRYQWKEDGSATDAEEEAADDAVGDDGDGYECSRRIVLFNAPTIGVAVSSPLYWELRYGPNSFYWDVYDDGLYAYAYPSSWYWASPYSWSWSWGWGLYRPYWGWHVGWHSHWYWGAHHWHRPYWGGHYHGWHSPRPLVRPSLRYRQGSSLARGASRPGLSTGHSAGRAARGTGGAARRSVTTRTPSGTTRRSSATTGRTTPSRSTPATRRSTPSTSRSTPATRSGTSSTSRSTFRPSVSSPGRSGGFSPSRGGSMRGGGARGGRR